MIRNAKILGIAVLAVFALSAVSASAASAANGMLTSDGPVFLKGTENGENFLSAFGEKTVCPGSTFKGSKVGSTTTALNSGESSATITPTYVNCTSEGHETVVDMNGCDYVFHLGETNTSKADTYNVLTTVVCPENAHIQITVFEFGFRVCTLTITQNAAGYTGLSATDTTNGTLDVNGTVTGISSDKAGLCGEAATNEATLTQNILVKGENSKGKETAISLSHL